MGRGPRDGAGRAAHGELAPEGGLGKDPERAAVRAQQLAAVDEDWNCPWPLHWQRHYRVLADLVDADGHLPDIAPGVLFEAADLAACSIFAQ